MKFVFWIKALLLGSVIVNIALLSFALSEVYLNKDDGRSIYYRLKKLGYLDKEVALNDIKIGEKTMVMLTLGQSNAANSAQIQYDTRNRVYNYSDGRAYVATDPLIGSDGFRGSVWGPLSDLLIDSGLYDQVIIVPIAIGSTPIECWAEGECHKKLVNTLESLKRDHVKLTHVLWHQGESNNRRTTKEEYKKALKKIQSTIDSYQHATPFYCSIASYTFENGVDSVIQSAQKEFIKENDDVYYGVNTDTIIEARYRFDSQHFSKQGIDVFSMAWLNAIKTQGKQN